MSKRTHKLFSLQEANALIPELSRRIQHLRTRKETYNRLHDALFVHELVSTAERANGFFEKDDLEENVRSLEQAIENLAKDIEAIFGLGCILRDIEKGRVDFPAVLRDQKIYWSWQDDEPSIKCYRLSGERYGEKILISRQALEGTNKEI